MSENDQAIENNEEEIELETPEEELNEETDWKAEAIKARGIAKRHATKLEKLKLANKVEKKVEKVLEEKKQGFDYAEKAYLKASGIAPDEFSLVKDIMSSTGKSLDDVLETKYFQAELKERREAKATKDATPSSSKRSTQSARDQVEYWIAKGEMPPADQRELRKQVVEARIKQEQAKSHFSSNSVV